MRLKQRNFQRRFATCLVVVDGTECPVERPTDKILQKLVYSGKKKFHTLKYEGLNCYFEIIFNKNANSTSSRSLLHLLIIEFYICLLSC